MPRRQVPLMPRYSMNPQAYNEGYRQGYDDALNEARRDIGQDFGRSKPKTKRKPTAYQKRYGAAYKRLKKKHPRMSFGSLSKKAHKEAKR